MVEKIQHHGEQIQATKTRRSLIDDHAGRDRDRRNFGALEWSLGVTYKVLVVQGHTSVSPEHRRELHARLFPVKWRGLVNLRDGWIARAFQPLAYADLNPTGIPDVDELRQGRITMTEPPAGGLPRTMQLGVLLGWGWPVHYPERPAVDAAAFGSMTEQARVAYLDTLPARDWDEASATLAASFRERYMVSKGNPAQTWHNHQSRNAHAVRKLEARINTEGVRIEWDGEPNTEPSFSPISGDGPTVTVAQVVFGA